ncbi:MAG: hypothetical protein AUI16_26880 [Alphaproteobacteria bacterium 13_2_20CM_2_64_7]|nr:MAG: hypothetical protein AUI16_26880 [Alphaproteobacteria bacterium 13_2_20CM_2_64_7]
MQRAGAATHDWRRLGGEESRISPALRVAAATFVRSRTYLDFSRPRGVAVWQIHINRRRC